MSALFVTAGYLVINRLGSQWWVRGVVYIKLRVAVCRREAGKTVLGCPLRNIAIKTPIDVCSMTESAELRCGRTRSPEAFSANAT